jgi:hypothetical protein
VARQRRGRLPRGRRIPTKLPDGRITFFPDLYPAKLEAWRADMRVLGWIEGQDLIVMQSGIEMGSRGPLDEAAQRVVENKPDLVFLDSHETPTRNNDPR